MLIIGHRGAAGEAPENTVAAFRYALEHGITVCECDVRLSADKELAVIHDANVDRTTDAHGRVAAFTADQLGQLDARNGFPAWPERTGVPTLKEVLAATTEMQGYLIEIKKDADHAYDDICRRLLQLIRRYAVTDRVVAISFEPKALETMRGLEPAVKRGFIGNFRTIADVEIAMRLDCAYACVNLHASNSLIIRTLRERGIGINVWTCNTEEVWQIAAGWQVDTMTTDFPTKAAEYFRLHAQG